MRIVKCLLKNGSTHWYGVGDIMNGDLEVFLNGVKEYGVKKDISFVYTDPPWTSGNCKYWRTMANRQDKNIESFKVDYKDFLACLHNQLPLNVPLFIEGSVHTYNTLINTFKDDYENFKCFKTYYNGKPQVLTVFSDENLEDLDLNGKRDDRMMDFSFQFMHRKVAFSKRYNDCGFGYHYLSPLTVLDPCVGLGDTARMCYFFGCDFVGFDLNRSRVERTIESLNPMIDYIARYEV